VGKIAMQGCSNFEILQSDFAHASTSTPIHSKWQRVGKRERDLH
jgi:hypothetical protein